MKKRFLTKKPAPTTLQTATTDELFTELIKRIRLNDGSACYFVDSTSTGFYPQWSMYQVNEQPRKFVAKEIK